jgi:hypothetical protein
MEKEIEELKEIINNAFNVDISEVNRNRKFVDARRVYSKILRERGYTFYLIADSIKKDHASIVHYMKSIDSILLYDKELKNKYIACKRLFLEDRGPLVMEIIRKDTDLFMTVVRLNSDLQEAIKERKEILTKFVDYLEQFEKTTGYVPNTLDIKRNILPKFNS